MAAKFFTGLPLDGTGSRVRQRPWRDGLAAVDPGSVPVPTADHSRPAHRAERRPVTLRPARRVRPARATTRSPRRRGAGHVDGRSDEPLVRERSPRPSGAPRRRLPNSVYKALLGRLGAGRRRSRTTSTPSPSSASPRTSRISSPQAGLATAVMGQPVSMPVLISPTGVQAVHPDGEVAVARAGRGAWHRDRVELLREQARRGGRRRQPEDLLPDLLVRYTRARSSSASTGPSVPAPSDSSSPSTGRSRTGADWGSPSIPEQLDLQTMLRLAPEVARHPRWLALWARTGALPDSHRPQHGLTRRARARVLRRLRRVDAGTPRRHGTTSHGCASSGTGPSC